MSGDDLSLVSGDVDWLLDKLAVIIADRLSSCPLMILSASVVLHTRLHRACYRFNKTRSQSILRHSFDVRRWVMLNTDLRFAIVGAYAL